MGVVVAAILAARGLRRQDASATSQQAQGALTASLERGGPHRMGEASMRNACGGGPPRSSEVKCVSIAARRVAPTYWRQRAGCEGEQRRGFGVGRGG